MEALINSNPIPVKQLKDRYNIRQTTLRNRLTKAEISPFRQGKMFYVSAEQLEILDRQHQHLAAGGTHKTFREKYLKLSENSSSESKAISHHKTSISEHIAMYPDAIVKEVNDYFNFNQRLKYNAVLEELCGYDWGLTAREIKELIGMKPQGDEWYYDCFVFIKSGKIGRCSTWKVVKKVSYQAQFSANSEKLIDLNDFEVDEGLPNYRNMKQVLAEN